MNFYKSAALALDHLDKYKGSVKGSLGAAGIETSSAQESKRILALVIETLKYRSALEQIIAVTQLRTLEKITFPKKTSPRTPSSQSLILVLLHDLLISPRGRIEASDKWPPRQAIQRHQARLKAELVKLQIREGKSSKEGLARTAKTEGSARYIRWNPNVDLHREDDWSLAALLSYLQTKPSPFKLLNAPVYPVPDGSFFLDPHLPECLLVFPATTSWWQGDKWFESGAVIVQDKSSCFPARVLMGEWDEAEGDCIDATAAPGNKTSHMSALMRGKQQLHAFEKSTQRFKTLQVMLEKAQCLNVDAKNADFLQSDPCSEKYSNVTRILLDPSCSGSGIVNRLDYLVDQETDEADDAKNERLEKLASFQLQMILHAFKFPSVKRIVYSTCSIHPEEDEQVVQRALSSPLARKNSWILAQRSSVLPSWPRRGREEHFNGDADLADGVIRCIPEEDHTNGFFVACFVRGSESVQNQKKRALEEAEDESESEHEYEAEDSKEEEEKEVAPREKTSAQLERRKRKKQKQKQKKRSQEV
ncbi:S-adenosyl-L-methionine-dependent methyltransferase [Kockovaella imperatae]|uniref:S-adenosyl-L-methionine-dependent methyltransferase n=1 Tax=Kockovaella imperatae TaxID=4999 RepID=A0A1Y1UMY8_9TREE|nr:S-adenosyl-L-methionine-dependent methyltransferase [Kockovaella imperatae]ORX38495.1 S-adenosyl-L-methionine-dependent methyltransferase [Kockovaella imperatae]